MGPVHLVLHGGECASGPVSVVAVPQSWVDRRCLATERGRGLHGSEGRAGQPMLAGRQGSRHRIDVPQAGDLDRLMSNREGSLPGGGSGGVT